MTLAGTIFPDFTLLTDTGAPLALSSLRGRTVVLYFYPKDDTTGCTQESCEFRDMFPRFSSGDAVILGISPDDVASHQKFKAKYSLPFTLLVDENHALAEQLGIWVEKQFMGNRYMGVQRTTYVIGADGTVRHVFEKVNPAGHADEVLAFLQGGAEAATAARAAFAASEPVPAPAAAPAAAPSKPVPAKPVAKKPAAKKPAAKQPAAKKPAAKKPAAKKPAAKKPAAKKPAAKKPAAKKPAAKKVVAKKSVRKPMKKVAKKVAKKPAKKVAKKVVKKVAKKVTKKVVRTPAKKVSKKAARKAVKKAAKRARKAAGKK